MIGNFWTFLLSCVPPTSLAPDSLEDDSPMSECGTLALGYGADIILKELCLSVLTCLRLPDGMTQSVYLYFI